MATPIYKFALTEKLIHAVAEHPSLKKEDFLPTLAEPDATGWDVRCAEPEGVTLISGIYYKIPLGFRCFSPKGWWAELKPRSSAFIKKRLHALYGTIDTCYANEWYFLCQYVPDSHDIINASKPRRIEFGDRIGQVIPVKLKRMVVETISNEEMDEKIKERNSIRSGGLGSTGNV